eukprot:67894-Amphidinium_carterae.3
MQAVSGFAQVVTMDAVEQELRSEVICDVDIQGARCSFCEHCHRTQQMIGSIGLGSMSKLQLHGVGL